MTIKGETARLNNEIVGNFLGGRYGKIKETKSKKTAMLFSQKVIFTKKLDFFKNAVLISLLSQF